MATAIGLVPGLAHGDNPIVQTVYTADPAPLVVDDTVYLYTGHDDDSADGWFTMNEWRVYSSKDIVNWTDHGVPLKYTDFSWSRGDAWAGHVAQRNGKFYFYVPTTSRSHGRMTIGVAVSDSPTGPFVDALGKPLIAADCGDIDPTVYIDEDDQAYLYWGNPSLCYVKLNSDMTSYSGSVVHVPMTTAAFGRRDGNATRTTLYEEGPWFYRRSDLYYLVYAAGGIPEYIAYSTSPGPTGPWTYRGVIMPTEGASFTNHAGVVDFAGKSYMFYHNGALPGGGGYHRSVAVEEFTYNADGSFPRIRMTSNGPNGARNLNPFVRVEAETIAWSKGVETEPCSEGGMNVSWIEDGDYIKVEGVDFGTGALSFEASVASGAGGGTIELRLDSETGTLVGTCPVPETGGFQSWVTTTCEVSGAAGVHDLFLTFSGADGPLFNLDYWKFTARDGGGGMGGAAGSPASTAGMGGGVSAGAPGSAGVPAIGGGSGANAAGRGGAAGSDTSGADDDGGCSCRTVPAKSGRSFGIALGLALGLMVRRRLVRTGRVA